MNCKKCGYVLSNQDQTCPNCGEVNELYNGGLGVSSEPVAPVTPAPMPNEPVAPVTPTPVPNEPVAPVTPAPMSSEPVAPVTPTPMPSEPVAPVTPTPMPSEPVAPVTSTPMPNEPVAPTPIQTDIPSMGNTNVAATPTSKPKKNGLFVATVIILALIIIGLGVFITIKLIGSKPDSSDNTDKTVEKTKTTDVAATTTIKYAGIEFTVPAGLTRQVENNEEFLIDNNKSFLIFLEGVSNTYKYDQARTDILSTTNEIKATVEQNGGTYINTFENTSYGRKYITISYVNKEIYYDEIYTEIEGGILFHGILAYIPSSKDTGYKAMNEFLSSAKLPTNNTFASNISDDNMKKVNLKTTTKLKK